MITFELII